MDPILAAQADGELRKHWQAVSTEITTAALTGEEPESVLPLLVQRAAELTRADLGVLMVRGEASPDGAASTSTGPTSTASTSTGPAGTGDPPGRRGGEVTVEAAYAPGGEPTGLVGLALSPRSAAARVARHGAATVVVEDFTSDPRTSPYVPPQLQRYGPFAVAPFGTSERRLGALAVYRTRGGPPFGSFIVDVLESLAAQAGLALVLAEGNTARQRVALYQDRERLARDLHDGTVQRLYATGMQLEALHRQLEPRLHPAEQRKLDDTIDQLDVAISEIRATVRALRSTDDEQRGTRTPDLLDTTEAEVATAGELLGFTPQLDVSGELAGLPTGVADHARAALRESLSNVVRHSGARSVRIRLARTAGALRLQVADDGCGIPAGVTRRGLGNLEQRAELLGGHCQVLSAPHGGTTVIWEAPLEGPE